MKFVHSLLLALSSAASLVSAQSNPFKVPPGNYVATAGQPLNLTWTPTTQGTVTLVLRSGSSANLFAGTVIACTQWSAN
ncbi:hypothetical protein BAUCODRAFT_37282 [Baudoinia panamericana UAMH 10762]|uniref:Yeast cell wall synthesis Kre9/Knh1-like N-terminal domain-containing protein n=1 Tax=Baudoinia panamericana (strain UAMH 10762) TaxID=717646 RepID=M2LHG3_BAUPA|nr:uncharacterized protein BAUCODRAFT_37282 [Baudoinia panamericana UAMH 10762]EMC93602.1 hypothetical protein BAUCODRAFT_37282 [Baudoinia panamericana UAMH 10762]